MKLNCLSGVKNSTSVHTSLNPIILTENSVRIYIDKDNFFFVKYKALFDKNYCL